jgi:hypothetical protein
MRRQPEWPLWHQQIRAMTDRSGPEAAANASFRANEAVMPPGPGPCPI